MEMMGLLARYFKGGLSISDMKKMDYDEIKDWYDIYVLQSSEESTVEKLRYDKDGKERNLPSTERIREVVIENIKQQYDNETYERINKKFNYYKKTEEVNGEK